MWLNIPGIACVSTGGASLHAHHIKVGQDPSEFSPYAPPLLPSSTRYLRQRTQSVPMTALVSGRLITQTRLCLSRDTSQPTHHSNRPHEQTCATTGVTDPTVLPGPHPSFSRGVTLEPVTMHLRAERCRAKAGPRQTVAAGEAGHCWPGAAADGLVPTRVSSPTSCHTSSKRNSHVCLFRHH